MDKQEYCPFCGNTGKEEFAIEKEQRLEGTLGEYTSYRASCSCGATGPDADTPEKAVELWNKRCGIITYNGIGAHYIDFVRANFNKCTDGHECRSCIAEKECGKFAETLSDLFFAMKKKESQKMEGKKCH